MKIKTIIGISLITLFGCNENEKSTYREENQQSSVKIVGAMKNVMWKGELQGVIDLDTIKNKVGLYGLGPEEYLTGEILIMDGKSFVSKVLTDSTMSVEETFATKAPFFVYANETKWNVETLPNTVLTIADLENYIDKKTTHLKRPFAFKLSGVVVDADIHVQNLPKGSVVHSPEEAHRGQVGYSIQNSEADIVGFFSTEHKGVFTHHDSFLHLHLITKDRTKMGHLDKAEFLKGKMKLYLPE